MYYDKYSIDMFELMHPNTDVLIKPIDNKVKTQVGLITTTNPSIIQHRSDKGEIIKSDTLLGKIVRFDYAKGIDIELKEGIFTLINKSDIICFENN